MTRFLFAILLMVFTAIPAQAAPPKPAAPKRAAPAKPVVINITVFDFKGGEGVPDDFPSALGTRLRQRLLEIPRYRIVAESNMGLTDVQQMVTGRISKGGEDYTLIIEILNPVNTTILSSYVEVCPGCGLEDLLSLTDAAADALFKGRKAQTADGSPTTRTMVRPEIPPLPSKLGSFFVDAEVDVMLARENALIADRDGETAPERAAAGWKALAALSKGNPYQSEAAKRQRDWEQFADQKRIFDEQQRTETEKLTRIMSLESVSRDEKRKALWSFSKRFGGQETMRILQSLHLHPDVIADLNSTKSKISTVPEQAAVMIDGTKRGTSPWTGDVLNGSRKLRLELEGYHPVEQSLLVLPELPNEVAVTLMPYAERFRWAYIGGGVEFVSPDLEGRKVDFSGATMPLEKSLLLKATNDKISAGQVPWGISLEAGQGLWSAGYRFMSAKYEAGSFAPHVNATGVLHVQEAALQRHALRGLVSHSTSLWAVLRGAAGIEVGYERLQVAVSSDRKAATYTASQVTGGGFLAAYAAYRYVTLGVEAGAYAGQAGGLSPDARVIIGIGLVQHEYR